MPYVSKGSSTQSFLNNSLSTFKEPESSSSFLQNPIQRKRKPSAIETDDEVHPYPNKQASSNNTPKPDFYNELFPSSDDESNDDDDDDSIDPLGFSNKVKRSIIPPASTSPSLASYPPAFTDDTRNLDTLPLPGLNNKNNSSSSCSRNTEIHVLLYEQEWNEAFRIITDYRDLAKVKDDGSLPLHIALVRDAPLSLLQTIIQAYPDACKEQQHRNVWDFPLMMAIRYWKRNDDSLPTRRDKEILIKTILNDAPHMASGSHVGEPISMETVLHALLETRPSLDLTKYLVNKVEALPGSGNKAKKLLCRLTDKQKQLPLHVALDYHCDDEVIAFLISKYPQAVGKERINKETPLHVALLRGCTARVLELLLVQGYDALLRPDIDGNNPLHLWFSKERVECNLTRFDETEHRNHNIMTDLELFEKIVAKFSLTEVRKLLLTVNESGYNMIDAAKNIKDIIDYPQNLLARMESIMRLDEYEVCTDDES